MVRVLGPSETTDKASDKEMEHFFVNFTALTRMFLWSWHNQLSHQWVILFKVLSHQQELSEIVEIRTEDCSEVLIQGYSQKSVRKHLSTIGIGKPNREEMSQAFHRAGCYWTSEMSASHSLLSGSWSGSARQFYHWIRCQTAGTMWKNQLHPSVSSLRKHHRLSRFLIRSPRKYWIEHQENIFRSHKESISVLPRGDWSLLFNVILSAPSV